MTDTVTLANGKIVTLDEFLSWSNQRQLFAINKERSKKISDQAKGRRGPRKGVELSDEVKKKISESKKKHPYYTYKKVQTPIGMFPSVTAAHKALGLKDPTGLYYRMKTRPNDYFYVK